MKGVPTSAMKIAAILFQGAVLVAILIPFVVGVFIEINVRTSPDIWWFVVPAFGVVLWLRVKAVAWFESKRQQESKHSEARLSTYTILLGVALGLLALTVEYIFHKDLLVAGKLLLPGDTYLAPKLTQMVISLFLLGMAGPIEETAFRSVIQLRLQNLLPHVWVSEIVADALFVAMHFERTLDVPEAVVVVGIAVVCGRVTTVTKNIRYPILIHTIANIGNAIPILLLRR